MACEDSTGQRPPVQPETDRDPDFLLSDHGSLFLLQPLTSHAWAWIAHHIDADAPRMGSAVAIERRYVGPIVEGIAGDGLIVAGG